MVALLSNVSADTLFNIEQGKFGRFKGQLVEKLLKHDKFDDQLMDSLLISTRTKVHHLLYDEVLSLMQQMVSDFDEIIELESIGKSY